MNLRDQPSGTVSFQLQEMISLELYPLHRHQN